MTRPRSLILVIACTFFTSIAQLLYKQGVSQPISTFIDILTNYWIISGLVLYGIGAVLLIVALRDGDVSVLYPVIATSYIWVSLFSMWLFNEQVTLMRWIGIAAIVIGITYISLGSNHATPGVAQ